MFEISIVFVLGKSWRIKMQNWEYTNIAQLLTRITERLAKIPPHSPEALVWRSRCILKLQNWGHTWRYKPTNHSARLFLLVLSRLLCAKFSNFATELSNGTIRSDYAKSTTSYNHSKRYQDGFGRVTPAGWGEHGMEWNSREKGWQSSSDNVSNQWQFCAQPTWDRRCEHAHHLSVCLVRWVGNKN